MYPKNCLLRENLLSAHQQSWEKIAAPGAFLTGAQRVDVVRTARAASTCELCQDRKAALSPNAIAGEHNSTSTLGPEVVDMIHRIHSDPGRLTKSWFDQIIGVISQETYVEIVSVINSVVIIDTLHAALGLDIPALPLPQPGQPSGAANSAVVDDGAWLPILDVDNEMAETGLPRVPNIARSLGLVPSAMDLFFGTFRPHYALQDIKLSISQAQAEFVAARVSAMNECFY